MVTYIGIAGKMGSGKDTFAENVRVLAQQVAKLKNTNPDCVITAAFADPVCDEVDAIIKHIIDGTDPSEIAATMNVSVRDVEQMSTILSDAVRQNPKLTARTRTPEIRQAKQFWGTDVRRKQNDQYWINALNAWIDARITNDTEYVMITDARFANELDYIASKEREQIVYLVCDEDVRIQRLTKRDGQPPKAESLTHKSETDMEQWCEQAYNNGTVTIDKIDVTNISIKNYFEHILNILGGV